ncbi:MAG: lysine--tRNA ligase [bacterium]
METYQDLIEARRKKLDAWRAAGFEPYPYSFSRTHTVQQLLDGFKELLAGKTEVTVAGRLVAKRVMGKASFAHLHDDTARIQFYISRNDVNPEGAEGETTPYSVFKNAVDLGDWIGLRGYAMVTKTGEKTLHILEYTPLAKCIRPLPVVKEEAETGQRHHEFSDPDERFRNRPLDLIVNPDEREVFRARALIIRTMREHLEKAAFLEVETPVLQPLYGGGTARPFMTHHNQLKKDLYLRIADELYLKRLIISGLNRVYEISKDFRNEGVDRTHNPEFTMMECYAAFEDYTFMMELVESMVADMAQRLHGAFLVQWGDGTVDVSTPWPRVRFFDALSEAVGEDLLDTTIEKVREVADRHHIEYNDKASWGKIVDEIFGELVEPKLSGRATFIIDYPRELSPLAKRHREDKRLVERFEAFMGGMEVANAFSELNDPADQRDRFDEQQLNREAGDEEAMPFDEDYIGALELGLPPTAGLGMGVDRLAMILTNKLSIRDVILFPLLRDKDAGGGEETE